MYAPRDRRCHLPERVRDRFDRLDPGGHNEAAIIVHIADANRYDATLSVIGRNDYIHSYLSERKLRNWRHMLVTAVLCQGL
jgi:hypothetical protein